MDIKGKGKTLLRRLCAVAHINRGRLAELVHSTRGRNALTFLVFLVISTLFWIVMTLNDETQLDFDVPVEITGVPDDMTLITLPPATVSVSVKDKGTSLLNFEWGKMPTMKLQYKDFTKDGKRLLLGETQLNGIARSFFGSNAQIVTLKPDSLNLTFTTHKGEIRPIRLITDVTAAPQYIINGAVKAAIDTVRVYSVRSIPKSITRIDTEPVVASNLTDTTVMEVKLVAPEGMRVIPATVKVTIPVEPLIAKRRQIPVEVTNQPMHSRVITFPSTVEISYLIPMSEYNADNYQVKAYAEYRASRKKLPLTLSILPDAYSRTTLATDSVEYIVEHNQ